MRIVKAYAPTVVAVPVNAPVDALSAKPAGRVPAETLKAALGIPSELNVMEVAALV